ncbi:MAG: glutathione peroxidase [Phycisphaeraceae bacterium]|nr:glutathione peroxidase [Phycisphaeraceae bacterium]
MDRPARESKAVKTEPNPATHPSALDFTLKRIDGDPVHLASRYQGDVILIVNTASRCGLTPQYAQLQELHERYRDRGLSILGFPANNFGNQEPGTNEQIAEFCQVNYGVGFDMFSKISVKGEDIAPLYAHLTSEQTNPEHAGEITWNFEKFLIGRDGRIVQRFRPRQSPTSPEVITAIEAALAEGP